MPDVLQPLIQFPIVCDNCGKEFDKPFGEVVANDAATCPDCSAIIDLTTEEWRAAINEFADELKNFRGPSGQPLKGF